MIGCFLINTHLGCRISLVPWIFFHVHKLVTSSPSLIFWTDDSWDVLIQLCKKAKMSNYFFKKKRSIFWGAFDWLADVSANHSQLWRLLISAHPSSAPPRLCLLWLNVDCLTLVNENDENPEFDESVGDVPDVASMFFYSLFMLAGLSLPVKRLWTQAE